MDDEYASTGTTELITFNPSTSRREVLHLALNRVLRIGRDPALCSYVIPDPRVSALHFELTAVRSPNGGVIVSCKDSSKNGLFLNDHLFKKTCVIVMHKDTLRIPQSQTFLCLHSWDSIPMPLIPTSYARIGRFSVSSQCLGTGGFATVHLAMDNENQCQVACKRIKGPLDARGNMKEISILSRLKHHHINQMLTAEEVGNFTYIFLELCTGGDLFTYITCYAEKRERMPEPEAKFVMFQILKGLQYLHGLNIAHRDVKPENILLCRPGPYPRVVLADFGLARAKSYQETMHVCGTVSYLPPEGVLALDVPAASYKGMPSDCWSLGVTCYVMLTATHPFDYEDHGIDWITHIRESQWPAVYSERYRNVESRLKERIIGGAVDFARPLWRTLEDARTLIAHLLERDYALRATVEDALESSWISTEFDKLERLRDKVCK